MNIQKIDSTELDYRALGEMVKGAPGDVVIDGCIGQRFIGTGLSGKRVVINGIPGNALGAYLDGAEIVVNGNAQDAVGDTMNSGRIVIRGSVGDAPGYAMRGGEIFVRDNAGYRAGIHMKAYEERLPVLVIGGKAGSFLGEYQAGGIIIVLGTGVDDSELIGHFCGTGMHGGKIFLRAGRIMRTLPPQVNVAKASKRDMEDISPYLNKYRELFDIEPLPEDGKEFFVLTPNTKNPYKQLYVQN